MAGGQFLGFGADLGNITTSAIQSAIGITPKNRNMISWEKPLLRKIEETAAEHASSLNDSEREQVWVIFQSRTPWVSAPNHPGGSSPILFGQSRELYESGRGPGPTTFCTLGGCDSSLRDRHQWSGSWATETYLRQEVGAFKIFQCHFRVRTNFIAIHTL